MGIDLALIWAVIILFGIMMYVIMDGFDLGIGILFPLVSDAEERDVMVNTVAPVGRQRDLAGAGRRRPDGRFPLAYSVILHALHLPLVFMLLGLIFRGVAFEFRSGRRAPPPAVGPRFVLGSVCATFFQGVALGAHRASRSSAASTRAVPGTGSAPSRCSSARAWWPPMCCWAAPG